MQTRRTLVAALILGGSAAMSSAGAQTTGQFVVGGGSATDERGVHSSAMMLEPSVRFAGGTAATLTLGGDATLFQNNGWSLGGTLGAGARQPLGAGFAFALNGSADASRTSFRATFANADVSPTLEFGLNGFSVFGGADGAYGYTAVAAPNTTNPLGSLGGTTTLTSVQRSVIAPVYGARLRVLGSTPDVGAELTYREEPMSVAGVRVTDRTFGGALVAGPLTLSASAGRREAVDERVTYGTGSFEYALARSLAIQVSAGRYPSDRLTGAAGGSFVSAGLSLSVGGHASHALPAPRGVPLPPSGTTRLSIRAPDAQAVTVSGDWNDWQPVPANRASNGVWYADLRIPPGQYRYAFRIDGRRWAVPVHAVAVDDGFGGKAAYVTVRDAGAAQSDETGGRP